MQQVINGLMLGSMYSLVAIGYTLVFGLLNLLNFAHGDVFMFGGFIALFVLLSLKLPILVAFIGAMVGCGILGFILELVCFRTVKKEYHLAPALGTLGFSLVVIELTTKVWGTEPVSLPPSVEVINFQIGDLLISSVQILILAVAIVLMAALEFLILKTRLGRAMRAVAEDPTVAKLLGVNAVRTIVAAFVISSALAGAAGILLALRLGLANPHVGFTYGMKALAVMAIGGLGNVRGAMLGGLIIGMAEVLTVAYGSATYSDVVVWTGLIAILLFKPSGLLGTKLQEERR
ncbi:MAG: branched-chain amino acid ABC transporter permease [Dehalococcoidia bacterium]|nr:branched-chain amino acid ABC transporter permease [Dehalococcoidia bacterium]